MKKNKKKSPIPRKRTVRDLSRLVNKGKNVADSINTRMPTETKTETEFDIFGKSVAAQLKSLPIHKAVEEQMFIQNYLSNLRLQQMGHGTYNYAYSPSPNSMYQSSPSLPPRDSPYTHTPRDSPYIQPPQSSTPDATNDIHNISDADHSLNDNAITIQSENNASQMSIADQDDILARAISGIY